MLVGHDQIILISGAILLLVAVFFGGWIGIKLLRYFDSRKVKKRLNRGLKKEKEAVRWLRLNGYKILDYQCMLQYELMVNNAPVQIKVSPDFRVQKNGQEQLIEVKSGTSAPRIENKDTRRQLLEYHVIEPETPLFLLDMDKGELKKIDFQRGYAVKSSSTWKFWFGIIIGAFITIIIGWVWLKLTNAFSV